ncbi:MAG: glycosyltransferase family 4 protein [Actinomycetota bacterium]|nr:glycosyltransferase family 4 protein [Actinomycetota bacterium]
MNIGQAGLRVAILNPCYWPEVRRGSERFLTDLADGLIARGHAPRLITSHRGWPKRSVQGGLTIVRHWRPPQGRLRRRGFPTYVAHAPLSYLSLLAGNDDVAHALYPIDALAGARWSERTGRPSIYSAMGLPTRSWLVGSRYLSQATMRAATANTAFVVLSRAAAEAYERLTGLAARVIHPGVDLDAFAPGGERAQAPTFMCAASVEEPRKRVGLLLEAFQSVRRQRPDARLVLSRPRDLTAVRDLGDTPGVVLEDLDDRTALADAYRRAWVSVLPSYAEAFGLVLVEALACGTPVVGTAAGAIPEVIDRPEIGRRFDDADQPAASLAEALLEALELAEEPGTAAACRARAADFSLERCVTAYEALYRSLVQGSDEAPRRA